MTLDGGLLDRWRRDHRLRPDQPRAAAVRSSPARTHRWCVLGDTTQDGVWYAGHTCDVLGLEFGDKPFDPFVNLPDGDNEDDEWVFPLADPFHYSGNDVIDASALFAGVRRNGSNLPTRRHHGVRRRRRRPIIGSQTGDHLAGGSGDDEILGLRGVDHIYGDSGVNVNILTRAPTIATVNAEPAPTSTDPSGSSTTAPRSSPSPSPVQRQHGRRPRPDLRRRRRRHRSAEPERRYDDIIFGDHGASQNVQDPNDAGRPRAAAPDDADHRRLLGAVDPSSEFQNGNDDMIFGNRRPRRHRRRRRPRHGRRRRGGRSHLRRQRHGARLTRRITARRHHQPALPDAVRHAAVQPHRPDRPGRHHRRRERRHAAYSSPTAPRATSATRTAPRGGPSTWSTYDDAAHDEFAIAAAVGARAASATTTSPAARRHDLIFGQLGDDVVQGDGGIESAFARDRSRRRRAAHRRLRTPTGCGTGPCRVCDYVGRSTIASFDPTDGEDYIEGDGGNDVVFGGLGQDDIIGGSSDFFASTRRTTRWTARTRRRGPGPDGDDLLFGGAGQTRRPRRRLAAGTDPADRPRPRRRHHRRRQRPDHPDRRHQRHRREGRTATSTFLRLRRRYGALRSSSAA